MNVRCVCACATQEVRIGALLGLAVAYAGSNREDVTNLFTPFIVDTSATADMEVVSFAALALGLVLVGASLQPPPATCSSLSSRLRVLWPSA